MTLAPLLALLRKLLQLYRRWTNRPLLWLLKLFVILRRCVGLGSFDRGTTLLDNNSDLHDLGDTQSVKDESCLDNQGLSSIPTEHSVVLASSSLPGTPPQAHTQQHEVPSSDAVYDRDHSNSTPLDRTDEGSASEDGALSAGQADNWVPPARIQKKPRKPIAPSARPRYDRNVAIESRNSGWVFKPLGTFEVYRNQDVSYWKYHVHPEGISYYVLANESNRFCYLTEANLTFDGVLAEIDAFIEDIETHAMKFNDLPNNVEVVLDIQDGWFYYMVDLDQRCVFWLDDFDFDSALGEEFGVESDLHSRNQLDFEFWQHIHDFPNHPLLEMFSETIGILNYWRVDSQTSADSTAPYDDSDLNALVESANHLKGAVNSGNQASYAFATASVARIMGVIYNERHHNFYGSHGARLNVWQSVRGQIPTERSWLVRFLSPLLFYAPETYLSGLERLWADGDRRWKEYQHKVERNWGSFVLTSTVLLSVNVSLLSVPNVLSDQNDGKLWVSPAAVASQVSIVASIASIIAGLLLFRQNQISSKDVDLTAADVINYLSRRRHKQLGLETMAIQYSLPFALLLWSVVTFISSIAISCFPNVDGTLNTLQRIIYSVVWLCAISLILWMVLTGWETNNGTHWTQLFSASWWGSVTRIQWDFSDKENPWTWLVTRRRNGDVESFPTADVQGSGTEMVANDNAERHSIHSTTNRMTSNNRRWRIRMRGSESTGRFAFRSFWS